MHRRRTTIISAALAIFALAAILVLHEVMAPSRPGPADPVDRAVDDRDPDEPDLPSSVRANEAPAPAAPAIPNGVPVLLEVSTRHPHSFPAVTIRAETDTGDQLGPATFHSAATAESGPAYKLVVPSAATALTLWVDDTGWQCNPPRLSLAIEPRLLVPVFLSLAYQVEVVDRGTGAPITAEFAFSGDFGPGVAVAVQVGDAGEIAAGPVTASDLLVRGPAGVGVHALISAPGYESQRVSFAYPPQDPPDGPVPVRIELGPPPQTFRIVVQDRAGEPVTDARILPTRPTAERLGLRSSIAVGRDGRTIPIPVPAGDTEPLAFLVRSAGLGAMAAASRIHPEAEFVVTLFPDPRREDFIGRVLTSNRAPVEGMPITMTLSHIFFEPLVDEISFSRFTDAAGRYAFGDLDGGIAQITVATPFGATPRSYEKVSTAHPAEDRANLDFIVDGIGSLRVVPAPGESILSAVLEPPFSLEQARAAIDADPSLREHHQTLLLRWRHFGSYAGNEPRGWARTLHDGSLIMGGVPTSSGYTARVVTTSGVHVLPELTVGTAPATVYLDGTPEFAPASELREIELRIAGKPLAGAWLLEGHVHPWVVFRLRVGYLGMLRIIGSATTDWTALQGGRAEMLDGHTAQPGPSPSWGFPGGAFGMTNSSGRARIGGTATGLTVYHPYAGFWHVTKRGGGTVDLPVCRVAINGDPGDDTTVRAELMIHPSLEVSGTPAFLELPITDRALSVPRGSAIRLSLSLSGTRRFAGGAIEEVLHTGREVINCETLPTQSSVTIVTADQTEPAPMEPRG
jgi:hypothetical protein